MTGVVACQVKSPYPGLRPFEAEESDLFFGREPQIDELLRRLGKSRFVAVIGSSGSGKSSLVRAGLVPALVGGLLSNAGSHWRIAVFRPGGDPIGALTDELCTTLYPSGAREASHRDLIEITLKRSSLGLVEAVRQAYLPKYENLLVVADQFEELFRFHQTRRSPEALDRAAALVRLLLEATRQSEIPIHVLITMRSDFLGDCSQFRDLPETINEGLYLIPRMTRDQFRQAITGPAAVCGDSVSPQLTQQLLNDLNNDPDQLPVLQHALMRAWNQWRNRPGDTNVLELQEYLSIGGMAEALSRHADEAFEELSESDQQIAERLFQCLTEKGPDNREVRRPTRLGQICRILEVDLKSVKKVIERFREEDRAFLVPYRLIALDENSVIDISHESLIRKWNRLREWVDKEARSRAIYLRLAEAARLNRSNEAGLWRNPDLQLALDWKEQAHPNEAWAERYEPDFALAMDFLDRSVAALRAEEMQAAEMRETQARAAGAERARKRTFALLIGVGIVAGLFGWLLLKNQRLLKETMASRLATEAALLQSQKDSAIDESVLLAIESMRSIPLALSDEVARNGLALLPRQVLGNKYGAKTAVVVFSPGGEYVASGSADGTARVTDVATGKTVELPKQSEGVVAMAFSPNHNVRRLAVGGNDGTARLWEADQPGGAWKEVARLVHAKSVNAVAFSPDGRYLATASSDRTARVTDTETGKEVARITHGVGLPADEDARVVSLAFSPDGRSLVTGSYDHTARLTRVATGQTLWQLRHGGSVFSVAFSHDGRTVATGSKDGRDGAALVLDAVTGHELQRLQHEESVNTVAFSPDDKYLATSSKDFTARVMDTATGKEVARLKHQDVVNAVAFYPDGRFIATASDDHTARVMEIATRRELSRMGHPDEVHTISVDPGGRLLATGSADGSVRILAETTGKALLRDDHIGKINTVALTRSGRYLAIADTPLEGQHDGSVHVYDLQNKGQPQQIATIPGQPAINDISFSINGRFLAWGADKTAVVFDVENRKLIDRRFPQIDTISAIALSPQGRYLAIGGDNDKSPDPKTRSARIVELATGREVAAVDHGNRVVAVAFSPDEAFLATGSTDKTSAVFNIGLKREVSRYTHQEQVNSLAFSPDAKYVAAGDADGMLRVIEAATGKEVSRHAHSNSINSVAFSPDGKYVATGNEDFTARILEAASGREVSIIRHAEPVTSVKFISGDRDALQAFAGHSLYQHPWHTQDLIEQGCSQLSRNLTLAEWKQYLSPEPHRQTCTNLPLGQ
jgi:WD40 repeat protein